MCVGMAGDIHGAGWPNGEKRKQKSNRIQLDSFDLCAIRNIVDSFYTVRKEISTLNKILAVAKRDLNFQRQKTYLRKVLVEKIRLQI